MIRGVLLIWSAVGMLGFTKCQTQKSAVSESSSMLTTPPPAVADTAAAQQQKHEIFAPVVERLNARGVDPAFIAELMADPNVAFNESFVKINVTGYLKKADYSHNYNDYSISQNKEFLAAHDSLLSACEAATGVPKEVISSVMWVETKHGKYLGKYNVVSAYMSLALAAEPENVRKNKDALRSDHPEKTKRELKQLDKKIEQRARKKANWAVDQLVALEKMRELSPIPVTELYGSWAGAFGLSQFLPSSYLAWAKDGNNDGKINLFEVPDAVYSIANYLKVNGWGNSERAQRKAVFHYNNSNDYVDAVLTLASRITPPPSSDSGSGSVKSGRIYSPDAVPAPGQ